MRRLPKEILIGITIWILALGVVMIVIAFCIGMAMAGAAIGDFLAGVFGIEAYDFYENQTGAYKAFVIGGGFVGFMLAIAIAFGTYSGIKEWDTSRKETHDH